MPKYGVVFKNAETRDAVLRAVRHELDLRSGSKSDLHAAKEAIEQATVDPFQPKYLVWWTSRYQNRDGSYDTRPTAGFADASSLGVFWDGLSDNQKRSLTPKDKAGHRIMEIIHLTKDKSYYSHASAILEGEKLQTDESARAEASKQWTFKELA